jgi:thymidylate synthase ThyX
MKLISPEYEILTPIDGEYILKFIEKIGRVCYKSEDSISTFSAKKFIEMILKRGHESVLEHYNISVRFICNRGFCYDDQTEVLTKDGWKLFKDTSENDLFFTMNMATKIAEYQKRISYTEEHWDNYLIYGRSSMVDFAVTPNHRMLWYHYDSRINKKWNIDKCSEIYGKRVKFQRGLFNNWDGVKIIEEYPQQSNNNFAKFMGIFITDGTLYKSKNGGGRIDLCQIKQSGRIYIKDLLDNLGWGYKESKTGFRIYNTKLYYFLRRFFPVDKKKTYSGAIPEWIRMAPADYIKSFLNGCIVGDGSIHKKNGHIVIYTANKEFAGNFQELFMKIGLCASIRIDNRIGNKRTMKNNKIIENKVVQYVVSVTKRTNNHLFNKKHWSMGKYCGKVYCVTVPNGTLYVRRNGKSFWSGNTHELVRHRHSGFSQESTRYCNYSKNKFSNELTFIAPVWYQNEVIPEYSMTTPRMAEFENALQTAEDKYMKLIQEGLAPQDARGVLTIDLKTEIIITTNLREWRHILKLRTSNAAHPSMQELMRPLLNEFKELIPVVFDDISYSE